MERIYSFKEERETLFAVRTNVAVSVCGNAGRRPAVYKLGAARTLAGYMRAVSPLWFQVPLLPRLRCPTTTKPSVVRADSA